MKEVLKRCATLAHLDINDVSRLEADICDMISMADSLSKLDIEDVASGFALPLSEFRADEVENICADDAGYIAADVCVPRISGV